jgi:hypothetical protein
MNRSFFAFLALGLPLAAASAACGGSGTGGSGGGTSGTGTTAATSSTGDTSTSTTTSSTSTGTTSSSTGTGGGASCPGPGFGGGETSVMGGSVTATVVDENGAPVSGQPVYICGIDICSNPGKTDASGQVMISTNLMMKKPAFKFGDSITYAELAIPLTMATTTIMKVGTGKLPASGAAIAAAADAVSGGVTLSVPKGADVEFNIIIFDTPEKQQLRAVQIPLTNEAPVLDPMMLGFEMLYGMAPAGTTICPAAKVTVPNTPKWAANTPVEFWVMTIDTGQEFAPYAGWAKASDGAVSADGMTVSTSDGAGFTYLDNFAVRKKP